MLIKFIVSKIPTYLLQLLTARYAFWHIGQQRSSSTCCGRQPGYRVDPMSSPAFSSLPPWLLLRIGTQRNQIAFLVKTTCYCLHVDVGHVLMFTMLA